MFENVLKEITPPFVWKVGSKINRVASKKIFSKWEHGVEQPAEFYDETFHNSDNYHVHYTESRYYPLWTIIADRIKHDKITKILDIGCGPGQVASLLHDKGIPKYLGVDFSPARVKQARLVCPEYDFIVADMFNTDLLKKEDYDCVLIMEFLEHVEPDIDVIKRVKNNSRIIATVPNFPYTGHVRHFKTSKEVHDRYKPFFTSLDVEEHIANIKGKKYFLIDGIR